MRSFARSMKSWSMLAVLATGLSACAGDVVDIDRTQANVIAKSLFEGEWYFRPVVVEVQYNQGMLFEGLEFDMNRVRWKLTENELIAYRSWELLAGAETSNGDLEFNSNPVAIFAINSHFDKKRDYNAATGEQTNIIVENTTDRPWYERDYVRVDWSTNLLGDSWNYMNYVTAMAGSPFYVQEHELDSPFRAEVNENNINVVNNYVLTSDLWSCYEMGLDPYFCGDSSAKIKLSFKKLAKEDYVPLYYPDNAHILDQTTGKPLEQDSYYEYCIPGNPENVNWDSCQKMTLPMFARFGFFRSERRAYDTEYQWMRSNRVFLANRFNIWKKSRDGGGNVIPEEFREAKPIIYYANPDHPTDAEVWEGTQALANDWDRAFKETVYELQKTRHPEWSTAQDVPTMYEVRENSCNIVNATKFAKDNKLTKELAKFGIKEIQLGNLKRACAVLEAKTEGAKTKFVWQKQGDLRHSFMTWVNTPQVAGPLGYGPSAADPVTGEIISANANIYGAAVDNYAAHAADVVSLMNGDLDLDSVVTGENVRRQMQSKMADQFGQFSATKMASVKSRFKTSAKSMGDRWFPNKAEASTYNRAKFNKVKGSQLERDHLMNDDLKRALLGPSQFQPGQAAPANFSPMADMEASTARKEAFRIEVGKKGLDFVEWSDEGMAQLAGQLDGMSWDEIYKWMRKEIHRSISAHEVGHTLGLRHNFEGSFDALNFHPDFWSFYNQDTGKVDRVDAQGNPTRAERLMYSSIMDYDARFYADSTEGIGLYDYAAIKFGYGQLVEVFEPGIAAYAFESFQFLYDYTKIPKLLSGELSCDLVGSSASANPTQQNCPGYFESPELNALFSGAGRSGAYFLHALDGVQAEPGNISRRTYMPFKDVMEQYSRYYTEDARGTNVGAYQLPQEVPYMFCSDEYSFSSNITCLPYDKGASYVEITQDRMERYEKYYFFTNFRRDRMSFNGPYALSSYINRVHSRFFSPMADLFRSYLYGYSGLDLYDNDNRSLSLNDFPVGEDWQGSAMLGLNYLVSVLNQVEPGDYCKDNNGTPGDPADDTYRPWSGELGAFATGCAVADQLVVPVGTGKYYDTKWTDDYYYKTTRIGTFYDKYAAIFALTSNEGSFYRNFSDMLDDGAFVLSYWRELDKEMLDLFSELFTGKGGKYSLRYDADAPAETSKFRSAPLMDIFEDTFDYTLPRIQPNSSWTMRYYAAVLPMVRFNSMYDYSPDFSNYARICMDGYMDCQSFGGLDVVEYTDPLSGLTYRATEPVLATEIDPADGEIHKERAIGARMLEEATEFALTYQPAKDALTAVDASPATCELTNTEADALGVAHGTFADTLTPDQLSSLRLGRLRTVDGIERGINERTSFIDVVRQITFLTEFGG